MSGGSFDYYQWHIDDIANSIENYIYGHSIDEDRIEEYIKDHWLENEEKEYIIKNKHTLPNRREYSEETIEEFKKIAQNEGIKYQTLIRSILEDFIEKYK